MTVPSSVVDALIATVADLASVPPDEVTVVYADAVTFPNGSLGCEQPGMMYTQVQVDGYRVVLEADGVSYDYRGTGSRPPRRCLKPAG